MDNSCWDLHGKGQHRLEFKRICEEIVRTGITTRENLLVAQVIEYLKKKHIFKYKAIRALGTNSVSRSLTDNYLIYRLNFIRKSSSHLDLHPPVQVCLIDKTALSLQNYLIVYPEEYVEAFV